MDRSKDGSSDEGGAGSELGKVQKWVSKKGWGFISPCDTTIVAKNGGQNIRFEAGEVQFCPSSINKGDWVYFHLNENVDVASTHAGRVFRATGIVRAPAPVPTPSASSLEKEAVAEALSARKKASEKWLESVEPQVGFAKAEPLEAVRGYRFEECCSFVELENRNEILMSRVSTLFEPKSLQPGGSSESLADIEIHISCSFAEDMQGPFDKLCTLMGMPCVAVWQPYGAVLGSLENTTPGGKGDCSFSFIRLEDLIYPHPEVMYSPGMDGIAKFDHNIMLDALNRVVHAAAAASSFASSPHIVVVCPPSPIFADCSLVKRLHSHFESQLCSQLSGMTNVYPIPSCSLLSGRTLHSIHDEKANRMAHSPYTSKFLASMALFTLRMAHRVRPNPKKVIVVDCDNTLWKGAVGELGVQGIDISRGFTDLQRFLAAQVDLGMLVCLSSRNIERDVLNVFEERVGDMVLKMRHIVTYRINWDQKSKSIKAMSKELNLGLDSFVFIDDNPVECAEVAGVLPMVTVIQLPEQPIVFGRFLESHWVFDRELGKHAPTKEDLTRTEMYKANAERQRMLDGSASFDAFLASINLCIDISPMNHSTLARSAQLTQRTNQFNSNKHVYSESELRAIQEGGGEIFTVSVTDRFGHYGHVGLLVTEPQTSHGADAMVVAHFLMSCRVLHRGVEHAMMRRLAKSASERGALWIDMKWVPSERNEPARAFLFAIPQAQFRTADGSPFQVIDGQKPPEGILRVAVDVASGLSIAPVSADNASPDECPSAPTENQSGDALLNSTHTEYGFWTKQGFSLSSGTYRMISLAHVHNPQDPCEHLMRSTERGQNKSIDQGPSWKRMLETCGVDGEKASKMGQEEFRRKMRHGVKLLVKEDNKQVDTYATPAPPPGASDGYI